MAFKNQIKNVNFDSAEDTKISTANDFEPIKEVKYIKNDNNEGSFNNFNWLIPLQSQGGNNPILDSISKDAIKNTFVEQQIIRLPSDTEPFQTFEKTYFSHIGVVLYKLNVDRSTGKLVADFAEAYTGSIFPSAGNDYIGDKINERSNLVRFYANNSIAETVLVDGNQVKYPLYIMPGETISFGLNSKEFEKTISFNDISKALDISFEKMGNPLSNVLDIICDAGLSTIAQFISVEKGGAGGDDDDQDVEGENIDFSSKSKTKPKFITSRDGNGNGDANKNKEFDINIIKYGDTFSDDNTSQWLTIVNKYKAFAESRRKDCVFITETPRHFSLIGNEKIADKEMNRGISELITDKINYISGINSSYGWGYAPWFKTADAFSGKTMWMPSSPYGAATYITTRRLFNVWDAPAGMTRGGISVSDLSFEPDLRTRDVLYSHNWNYALKYTNGGTVLEGQKTFQLRPSALDRINVRSLFLYIKRRVFEIAQYFIYEPNTGYTRQQFVDTVTPFLEGIKAAGGVYDYKLIADESINTSDVIDNQEFRVRILLKPTKTMEFILIELVATRTGANFEEIF